MEYIKTYIILYKSNTRVIYFSYMLNALLFWQVAMKFLCVQYDMMLVFSNEMVKFSWSDSHSL